jgi:hypothetical protein
MFLRQKLDNRKNIKNKIKELKGWLLRSAPSDELIKLLLVQLDGLQNTNLLIDKVNQQTLVKIGGTQTNLATAVEIRNTIKSKIDLITDLIATNTSLDITSLLEQRDNFMEEFNSLDGVIRVTDWNINLD